MKTTAEVPVTKRVVWFLGVLAIVAFSGCGGLCKDNSPWYGCSSMSACCSPDDKKKPCFYEATRNGKTKEFVCKSRDDCDDAGEQVAWFCD